MKKNISVFTTIIISSSIVLFIGCLLHWYQFNNQPEIYTKSILISIEIVTLLLVSILNVINFIRIIRALITKNFREMLMNIIWGGFSMALIILSVIIDSPTLVFST